MTYDGDETTHEVRDGDRVLQFAGQLLGSSSSEVPGKDRWAEIFIYRTTSGKYVVAGVGRTRLAGEVDRHWAQVCERAEGVVERLHLLDDDRSRYLPRVSKVALDEARATDPDLAAAYVIERVD